VSPDGRRIYAFARPRRGHLARLDRQTGAFVPYLDGISAAFVDFSRDGRWITFVAEPDATLWRQPAGGGAPVRLSPPGTRADGNAWSPDGRTIACRIAFSGEHTKIYLIPRDGGSVTALTARDAEEGIPSWAPDGTKLTFGDVPEQFQHPTGSERIHVFDLRTGSIEDLPQSQGLWTSRWSPDGEWIAALTIVGQRLMLYDVVKRTWHFTGVEHVNTPTWSRDSRYIYYDTEAGSNALRRVRIADGMVENLVDLDRYPTSTFPWSGLTPDGSPLVLDYGAPQIVAIDLAR
jgi:Tol biopolymer transport system component